MRENLLIDKSIAFAARILKLHKYLIRTQKRPSFQSRLSAAVQVLAQISMKQIMARARRILYPNCILR